MKYNKLKKFYDYLLTQKTKAVVMYEKHKKLLHLKRMLDYEIEISIYDKLIAVLEGIINENSN